MTVQLGSAYGKVEIDTAGAETSIGNLSKALGDVSGGMKKTGAVMTGAVTAPLVGVAAASVSSAMGFNELLANVQSLGVSADRVEELRGSVQGMASETGKSTSDLTGGLYQVISAFGDSADTAAILGINAKAAAAGLATTEEAIALTSAVTKGYGDTSAEAVQKASDLAFQVVKLGQTTFPELAGAMGNVVPLAATLGVTQEELAAQFATLTGVTGSASEVSTQLRATYQAVLKPTEDMAGAIANVASELDSTGQLVENQFTVAWKEAEAEMNAISWQTANVVATMAEMEAAGQTNTDAYRDLKASLADLNSEHKDAQAAYAEAGAALGQSLVQSVGYDQALQMLAGTAEGNTNTLGKMFGSVEALNAVMALSGPQADTYAEKYAAMGQVVGTSNDAFEAQTQGVNSAGFELQQMKIQLELVSQKLGEALIPALTAALGAAQPLIEGITSLVTWFTNLDSSTQTTILAIAGVAAVIGPLVMGVGFLISGFSAVAPIVLGVASGIGTLAGWLFTLVNPVTIVIGLVAGIAAVLFDWGGANEAVASTLESWGLQGVADGVRDLHKWVENVSQAVSDFFSGETSFSEFFEAVIPDWISTLFDWAWPLLGPIGWIVKLTEWGWPYLSEIKWIGDLMDWSWPTFNKPKWLSDLLDWSWPKFPSLPGWMGGGSDTEEEATGTNYARGGTTLVGERGPELIQLPRGSRVYDAQETKQMMGTGGSVNITVNVASLSSQLDIEAMAYKIAGIIRRQQAYS